MDVGNTRSATSGRATTEDNQSWETQCNQIYRPKEWVVGETIEKRGLFDNLVNRVLNGRSVCVGERI